MTNLKTVDGIEFKGDVDIADKVVAFLAGTEYSKVNKYVQAPIQSVHSSWFEWGDKGSFRAWGLDAKGNVVCGIRTRAEYDYKTQKYVNRRVEIAKMDQCDDWGS